MSRIAWNRIYFTALADAEVFDRIEALSFKEADAAYSDLILALNRSVHLRERREGDWPMQAQAAGAVLRLHERGLLPGLEQQDLEQLREPIILNLG
ncbi:MAG: hypothetical protein AAF711_04980 [Planctomycetota bacterium]